VIDALDDRNHVYMELPRFGTPPKSLSNAPNDGGEFYPGPSTVMDSVAADCRPSYGNIAARMKVDRSMPSHGNLYRSLWAR